MILRKPYAFIIKHFRLINLLLTVLASYIMYKTYHIVNFFNDFVKNNYIGSFFEGFYQNYISFFLFVALFLILFGILLILFLFIYKKKPIKVYISSFIYYIFLLVVFIFVRRTMITLETNVIDAERLRIIRDITVISIIPQLGLIITFLIRAIGINLSKFNFAKDLKELEIDSSDYEEVEITINGDSSKIKRVIRRFFREFSYYIKENKFIFILIIGILLIVIGYLIYANLPKNYDQTYNEGNSFNIDGITYNFEDSILTNMDYRGNLISKNNYYLVIRLKLENTNNYDYNFDYQKIKLLINKEEIIPSQDLGAKFIDFAPSYNNSLIKKMNSYTFSLIYPIAINNLKSKFQLEIDNGYINTKKGINNKNIYVNIIPEVIDEIEPPKKAGIDETISFSDSYLKETTLKINNYINTSKYDYNYESCINGKCDSYNDRVVAQAGSLSTLLVFDYEYSNNSNLNILDLINRYGRLYYSKNNQMVYSNINNRTPNNLKDKIIIEVSSDVLSANEVYLSFMIRNKEYLIRIK